MLAFSPMASVPIGGIPAAVSGAPADPPVGGVDATKVPASRVVIFSGGVRVVAFEGGTRTVRF